MIPAVVSLLAEALFCTDIQPSDHASFGWVCGDITAVINRLGPDGCVGLVAQEYGDHPEAAVERMGWALDTVTEAYALSPA